MTTIPVHNSFGMSPLVQGPQVIYAMTKSKGPWEFTFQDIEICEEEGGQIIGTGRVLCAYPLSVSLLTVFRAAAYAPQMKERRALEFSWDTKVVRLTGLPVKQETFLAETLGGGGRWDTWYVIGWCPGPLDLVPDDPFDGKDSLCDLYNRADGWQIRRESRTVSASAG